MIKTYKNKATEQVAEQINANRLPPKIIKRAFKRLVQLDNAAELNDLKLPRSNRLEKLYKDRKGQHSIRINDQYRVCFVWKNGDAFDVEITDYH